MDKSEWLGKQDDRNVFLFVEVSSDGAPLSTNILFFKPAKELNLPRPTITTTITKSISGFKITLRSDKLAKSVFLSTDQHEGFFTDNYFHLLPEQTVDVEFQTGEGIELEVFKKDLAVMSLVDAIVSKSKL